MHDWQFVRIRHRPFNSYGSDRESFWKCGVCGKDARVDGDKDDGPPYPGNPGDCEMIVVRSIMES